MSDSIPSKELAFERDTKKKKRLWKDFVTRKRKRWKLFRFINSEGKEREKCGEVNVVRGELDYRVSSFALLLFDDVVCQ